jgi:hypothetical protein
MSVFKTTFSRALKVIPSNDANIPYPNLIREGLTTDTEVNKLIDSGGKFVTNNVQPGDIVYNISTYSAATVIRVIDQASLELNADIISEGDVYALYNASSQTSNGNPGCYLYVGRTGSIEVTTIGQDIVTFYNVLAGTILPVQVINVRLDSTDVADIIALW